MTNRTLSDIALFTDVDPEEIHHLTRHSVARTYRPDEKLITQDAVDDAVFAIISGQTAVTRMTSSGDSSIIAIKGEGEIVGEMAVIENAPRSANVVALSDVTAYEIPGRVFEEVVQRSHTVAWKLMGELSNRLRIVNARATEQPRSTSAGCEEAPPG
jgi:CRP-like cAMP-binding protein